MLASILQLSAQLQQTISQSHRHLRLILAAIGFIFVKSLLYFNNNLIGTSTLLEVMVAHGCKQLAFSPSATIYGWPKEVPCTEEFSLSAGNPYRRTKREVNRAQMRGTAIHMQVMYAQSSIAIGLKCVSKAVEAMNKVIHRLMVYQMAPVKQMNIVREFRKRLKLCKMPEMMPWITMWLKRRLKSYNC